MDAFAVFLQRATTNASGTIQSTRASLMVVPTIRAWDPYLAIAPIRELGGANRKLGGGNWELGVASWEEAFGSQEEEIGGVKWEVGCGLWEVAR
jgi:hypothetical protein